MKKFCILSLLSLLGLVGIVYADNPSGSMQLTTISLDYGFPTTVSIGSPTVTAQYAVVVNSSIRTIDVDQNSLKNIDPGLSADSTSCDLNKDPQRGDLCYINVKLTPTVEHTIAAFKPNMVINGSIAVDPNSYAAIPAVNVTQSKQTTVTLLQSFPQQIFTNAASSIAVYQVRSNYNTRIRLALPNSVSVYANTCDQGVFAGLPCSISLQLQSQSIQQPTHLMIQPTIIEAGKPLSVEPMTVDVVNGGSVLLNVTNSLPATVLTNYAYTATYTLSSKAALTADHITVDLPTTLNTGNPWSYTKTCTPPVAPDTLYVCTVPITLNDSTPEKIAAFQPKIYVDGVLVSDSNKPYDITVTDQFNAVVSLLRGFTAKELYPSNPCPKGKTCTDSIIYQITNEQEPEVVVDKIEIDPTSLDTTIEGMKLNTTTCGKPLHHNDSCQIALTYTPTKEIALHYLPKFIATKTSSNGTPVTWNITTPSDLPQTSILVTYWVLTDASNGNIGDIVEDPATSTLYNLTAPSTKFAQQMQKSSDFGLTWQSDPALVFPAAQIASGQHVFQLQVLPWSDDQTIPLGLFVTSPIPTMMPNFLVSNKKPGWSSLFQLAKALLYTIGSHKYVFLLDLQTGNAPFNIYAHLYGDQLSSKIKIADFTQAPFTKYPFTQAQADPNRIVMQASNITQTLYVQILDDNGVARIFSADISTLTAFDPTNAWKDVTAIDLHGSNTQNVVFAVYPNSATQSDQLYTGTYRPAPQSTTIFKLNCTKLSCDVPGKTMLASLTTATLFAVGNNGNIYAALADGLYMSTDNAANFNPMNVVSAVKFPLQKIITLEKSRLAIIDNSGAMYINTNPGN